MTIWGYEIFPEMSNMSPYGTLIRFGSHDPTNELMTIRHGESAVPMGLGLSKIFDAPLRQSSFPSS